MEEMYEVLKFIEHGTTCRRSLDCVQGVSLIRRMKTHPGMDRRGLLVWFREIARCVDQYHRSGSGQDYRYLNPYSIIVTEEDGLRLLDLEAPDNASVIKQMQTGAVRDHFVRPVYDLGISRNHEADLFAYGKTIQFMLAYTEVRPSLTRLEEMKLQRVISRCTGESGKRYSDFGQVLKALPQIPEAEFAKPQGKKQRLKRIAGGVRPAHVAPVPSVVYTHPEFAWVGLSKDAAQEAGMAVRTGKAAFAHNAMARACDETAGFVELVCEESTGRLVGAQVVGAAAGDLVSALAQAIAFGATDEDLSLVIWPHPGMSETIQDAAFASLRVSEKRRK